jgi:hypothetical protein
VKISASFTFVHVTSVFPDASYSAMYTWYVPPVAGNAGTVQIIALEFVFGAGVVKFTLPDVTVFVPGAGPRYTSMTQV